MDSEEIPDGTTQSSLGELEQALQAAEAAHGAESLPVAALLEEYAAALSKTKGRYLDSLNAATRARHIRNQNSELSLSEEIGRTLDARIAKENKDIASNRMTALIVMFVVSLFMGWIGAVLMPTPLTPLTYSGSVLSSFGYCWFLFLSRSKGKKWFTMVCALPIVAIPCFWFVYRRESHIPGIIFLLGMTIVWNQSTSTEIELPGLNKLLPLTSPKHTE